MSKEMGKNAPAKKGNLWTTTVVVFILAVAMLPGCGQANRESKALEQMGWLVGTWERMNMKPTETAFETWTRESSIKFAGKGVTLRDQDTVFVETLNLSFKDEKLYYVAEVSHNEEPTYFEVTRVTDSGFVCENPQHDFPKKISYTLDGNRLTVVISGDGKSVPFQFLKSLE